MLACAVQAALKHFSSRAPGHRPRPPAPPGAQASAAHLQRQAELVEQVGGGSGTLVFALPSSRRS